MDSHFQLSAAFSKQQHLWEDFTVPEPAIRMSISLSQTSLSDGEYITFSVPLWERVQKRPRSLCLALAR